MNAAIIQRQIVETARERGFTEKHIAVMAFEIGKSITIDGLSDRQLETLLDALRREKREMIFDEGAYDLMCRCESPSYTYFGTSRRVSIYESMDSHKADCHYRKFIELTAR